MVRAPSRFGEVNVLPANTALSELFARPASFMNPVTLKKLVRSATDEAEDSLGRFNDRSRREFFARVWPTRDSREQDSPILRHYLHCCNYAFISLSAEAVSRRSNSDIILAIEAIEANSTLEDVLQSMIDCIHQGHTTKTCRIEDEDAAKQLLIIAAKVAFMCNIKLGAAGPGENDLDQRYISWNREDSRTLLTRAFPKDNKLVGTGLLERTFHARNLERLGSIQVVWTHNLLDHLRLYDPSKEGMPFRVSVFHHAQFLKDHENSQIFPEGLINETLRTLSLLFPGHVGGTVRWFKNQRKVNKDLDITACYCNFLDYEHRSIESFEFWRDRLTILKQTYDVSEPKTIFQWWNDGRKSERWATFWVAVLVLFLTVFFGVIQCIEGGLQVYKTYHPS